jgi:hypothetical protein
MFYCWPRYIFVFLFVRYYHYLPETAVSKFLFQGVLEGRGADEIALSQDATERASGLSISHRRLINKQTPTIDFQTAINRKGLPQPETNMTLEVHPVDQVNSAAIIDSLMTALWQGEQEIVLGTDVT